MSPPAIEQFNQLIARVQAGDERALSQLLEKYSEPLRRTARHMIGNTLQSHLDSEDLLQSVQIILWMGLKSGKLTVDSPQKLLALAKTLLRRKVARYCRSAKVHLTRNNEVSMVDTVVDCVLSPINPQPDPQQTYEFDDLVDHFLEQLGDQDRSLVKLRLEGYSTADAARKLGLDPGYLRVRLGRLRKRFVQFRELIVNDSVKETLCDVKLPDPKAAARERSEVTELLPDLVDDR